MLFATILVTAICLAFMWERATTPDLPISVMVGNWAINSSVIVFVWVAFWLEV